MTTAWWCGGDARPVQRTSVADPAPTGPWCARPDPRIVRARKL